MNKLLIIAGPQASGKTTLFNFLKEKYPRACFVSEINPFTVIGKNHLGAIAATKQTSLRIAKIALKMLKNLDRSKGLTIVETGIFQVVYVENILGQRIARRLFWEYLRACQGFLPIIVFIDTKPAVSFRRRKEEYLKRIKRAKIIEPREKQKMLAKYRQKIHRLYPLWLKYYRQAPFQKILVKNLYQGERKFLQKAFLSIKKLMPSKI